MKDNSKVWKYSEWYNTSLEVEDLYKLYDYEW